MVGCITKYKMTDAEIEQWKFGKVQSRMEMRGCAYGLMRHFDNRHGIAYVIIRIDGNDEVWISLMSFDLYVAAYWWHEIEAGRLT